MKMQSSKIKIPTEVIGIIDYMRSNSHNIRGKVGSMQLSRYDVTVCCNGGRVLRALVGQAKGSSALASGGGDSHPIDEIMGFCKTNSDFHRMVGEFTGLKIDIVFRMSGSVLVGAPLIQEKL